MNNEYKNSAFSFMHNNILIRFLFKNRLKISDINKTSIFDGNPHAHITNSNVSVKNFC